MADPWNEFLAESTADVIAELVRLTVEVAELRAENRRLLAVLASLPGTDRLLADLKTDTTKPPTAATAEGSTTATRERPSS